MFLSIIVVSEILVEFYAAIDQFPEIEKEALVAVLLCVGRLKIIYIITRFFGITPYSLSMVLLPILSSFH